MKLKQQKNSYSGKKKYYPYFTPYPRINATWIKDFKCKKQHHYESMRQNHGIARLKNIFISSLLVKKQ